MPSYPDGRHCGKVVPPDRANAPRERPLLAREVGRAGAAPAHRERITAFEGTHLARRPRLDKRLED